MDEQKFTKIKTDDLLIDKTIIEQSSNASLEKSISDNDQGDETGRRYRYQWIYTAIMCCSLLDDTSDAIDVFCEHHEDILIKHLDNTYTGIQVKTRAQDQPLWKTNDESIVDSCIKFCMLDQKFPGKFRAFCFATQHPLFSGRNSSDFSYVLEAAKGISTQTETPACLKTFIKKIVKSTKLSANEVLNTLKKTSASDILPKFSDVENRLLFDLEPLWEHASSIPLIKFRKAATNLINECMKASSLWHEDNLPLYLRSVGNHQDVSIQERIKGKHIDKVKLLEILQISSTDSALLVGEANRMVPIGTGDASLLTKKLDAGGLSSVSITLASDLRDKADYLGRCWTQKYGNDNGLARYDHIQTLVHTCASTSFEDNHSSTERFGTKMLRSLRNALRQKKDDGSEIYDCTPEHLEGFVYSLTAQCKVQWSYDRPWENKDD